MKKEYKEYLLTHLFNKKFQDTYIILDTFKVLVIESKIGKIYEIFRVKDKGIVHRTVKTIDFSDIQSVTEIKSFSNTKFILDDNNYIKVINTEEIKYFHAFLEKENIECVKNTDKKEPLFSSRRLLITTLIAVIFSIFNPIFFTISIPLLVYVTFFRYTVKKDALVTLKTLTDVNEKTNKLVTKNQNLEKKYKQLKNNKENELHEMMQEKIKDIDNLKINYETAKNELNAKFEATKISLDEIIAQKQKEIYKLELSLKDTYNTLKIKDVEVNNFEESTASDLKDKLAILSIDEKKIIKNNGVIVSDDESKKTHINNQIKQILRAFNTECDFYFSNVTHSNIDNYRNRITKSFETLNRIFKTDHVELTKSLLEIKLKKLNLIFAHMQKVEHEKALQKAAKEQLLEEQKVQRELETEKKKLLKEEKHFSNEVNKLMKYLQKSVNDIEKELYVKKIQELEQKLSLIEEDKKDVENKFSNTRAGHVYIISNIGSFGEDVFKIGLTRRLEPMDRVKELGDASVPFEFDVHAMIFSEDAPKLENTLHNHFKDRRVNKINQRKEFFKVSLDEIENVILNNHNETINFNRIPVAESYRQSLELTS